MKVKPIVLAGNKRWAVDGYLNGKRIRKVYASRSLAMTHSYALFSGVSHAALWASISVDDLRGMMALYAWSRKRGLSVDQLIQRLKDNPSPERSVSLREAISTMLESKQASGRRGSYIASLRRVLSDFARGRESITLDAVTSDDVLAFIDRRGTMGARSSYLSRIATLMSFALRQRWIIHNPCKPIEKVRYEFTAPTIFTVRQAARALVFTRRKHPKFLAYMALGLFAGVRPQEPDHIPWQDLDLDRGVLTITYTKTRHRRIVQLNPAAVSWLRLAKSMQAALPTSAWGRQEFQRAVVIELKLPAWPKDVMRHSYASYAVAHRRDVASVALDMGNSPTILLRHYRELVKPDAATRYFNLIPRSQRTPHAQPTLR
jgi:site-specific recombinase XerD